jgi:hypothetical protein
LWTIPLVPFLSGVCFCFSLCSSSPASTSPVLSIVFLLVALFFSTFFFGPVSLFPYGVFSSLSAPSHVSTAQ